MFQINVPGWLYFGFIVGFIGLLAVTGIGWWMSGEFKKSLRIGIVVLLSISVFNSISLAYIFFLLSQAKN